jgi:transposase
MSPSQKGGDVRTQYPDDLQDEEWRLIEPILTETRKSSAGRKPVHSKRELLNAMLYVLRTGCSWRHLPHDFPPWKSVYSQFFRWCKQGIFEGLNRQLVRRARLRCGRNAEPTGSIVDSQSVKTTEKGASEVLTGVKRSKVENVTYWLILEG